MEGNSYSGLDLLATAVFVLDRDLIVKFVNPAAENLFELSRKNVIGAPLISVLVDAAPLAATVQLALDGDATFVEHELELAAPGRPKHQLTCTITPVEARDAHALVEFRETDKQRRIAREERILHEQQLNRDLIRNLAHEIRNPLGGIRGAAQLLERELERRELREYTQVIRHEADRLQSLMDRLLSPNRLPQHQVVNIHEVLERVRSLILAEYPADLAVLREYDTSLPDLVADREQLIQAVLNIVRNAAQAMNGQGEIRLQSRIARRIVLAKRRYRLGIMLYIHDNGPGIPQELQSRIFHPLVSGREGGSGLGLMIAQNFINQHRGLIEFESRPGHTCFTLLLPITTSEY
jgi:two-component system, NtrC family, nitrogen regulation sensor histidine kinase GlnL